MSVAPHSFAARLKKLREERGWSKSALGRHIGVSTTCVWNWEEGNTEPRPYNLTVLGRTFGVSSDYLESGADRDTPPNAELKENIAADEPKMDPITLQDVISDARRRIGEAAGLDPSKVTVSLNYDN